VQTKLLELVEGKLPKELQPDHGVQEQNPSIRGDFLEKVRTKLITIQRASVESITETAVVLSNGKTIEADVIICGTGYRQTEVPYLPEDAYRNKGTAAPQTDLWKFMASTRYSNVYFFGYLEIFGPANQAIEAQVRVATAQLSGRIKRPSREEMLKDIKALREWQAKHFVNSPRHLQSTYTMDYIDDLLKPLGADITIGKLLGKIFTSNPFTALKVFNAVYFGLSSSAQWRLFGQDSKEDMAKATVVRVAGREKVLRKAERPQQEQKIESAAA
jgi:dimethylaniline monooxygenase (N-oxide forming)